MIQANDFGDFSFPKGQLKPGEEEATGASREWGEETDGLAMRIVQDFEPICVQGCKFFFAVYCGEEEFDFKATQNDEVSYVAWIDVTVPDFMLRNAKTTLAIQQLRNKLKTIESTLRKHSLVNLKDVENSREVESMVEVKEAPKVAHHITKE
jgi:ADP-ribose pyrophosphatase YjhB (NUDIX family)